MSTRMQRSMVEQNTVIHWVRQARIPNQCKRREWQEELIHSDYLEKLQIEAPAVSPANSHPLVPQLPLALRVQRCDWRWRVAV